MSERVTHKIRIVVLVLSMIHCIVSLTGCEGFNSAIQDMNGSITGNEYYASFYTNDGQNFMNMHGEKIDLSANTVYEYNYSSGSNERTLSSVVTIAIDGQEVENCGSTVYLLKKDWIRMLISRYRTSKVLQTDLEITQLSQTQSTHTKICLENLVL